MCMMQQVWGGTVTSPASGPWPVPGVADDMCLPDHLKACKKPLPAQVQEWKNRKLSCVFPVKIKDAIASNGGLLLKTGRGESYTGGHKLLRQYMNEKILRNLFTDETIDYKIAYMVRVLVCACTRTSMRVRGGRGGDTTDALRMHRISIVT